MNRLKKLWNALTTDHNLNSQSISTDPSGLRRMLTSCPACKNTLTDHSYAQFAINMATQKNSDRTIQFIIALKAHRWTDAIRFREFDGRYNAAEALALCCSSGTITVLIVRNPEELWESSSIVDYEVLDAKDAQRLNENIDPKKWHKLQYGNTVAT